MNKKIFAIILLLIVLGFIALFLSWKPQNESRVEPPSNNEATTTSDSNSTSSSTSSTQTNQNKTITLTGEYVCLPHKNTNGPQTMECAFGMKARDGSYYGLDTSLLSNNPSVEISTGSDINVTGQFVDIETLNSDVWQRYGIKGIIRVTSMSKI